MKKIDARKLSQEELLAIRQKVISLYQKKMPVMEIAKTVGLSWPTVNAAIKKYNPEDDSALKPAQRGRKEGTGRELTAEQESEICRALFDASPWGLVKKPEYPVPEEVLKRRGPRRKCRRHLWSRDSVSSEIKKQFGKNLSVRCVAKYLERWGFAPINVFQNELNNLCSSEVKAWLDENFENLTKVTKEEFADIYWVIVKQIEREKTMVAANGDQLVRRTGVPIKLSVVYAINRKGKEHWMIVKGKFSTKKQLAFLKMLIRSTLKRILLIRYNFRQFNEQPVIDWFAENNRRIELVPPQKLSDRA